MKKIEIATILSLILVTSGGFIALDIVKHESSQIFKGLVVLLSTILVFRISRNGLNKRDTNLLKLIFILIIFADLSLIYFKKPYIGIVIFFLVQCILIYRNIRCTDKRYILEILLTRESIILIFSLSTALLIYLFFIRVYIGDNILFILFILYGIIKSCSVFISAVNFRLKLFSKINRILLLIGIICFYLCDISVGLTLTLNKGFIREFTSFLIWIFYTPALTLIALSGYDFKKIKDHDY